MIEAACWRISESLRLFPPYIPHAVAVMVMALTFHIKNRTGWETR